MGWYRPYYLREGPGIEKDAPPKKGMALFFEILVREFWQLLKLNLLFALCALPLISFGAARAALSRCTVRMVRDVPNDVWDDFRHSLRQDLARNTAVGLAEVFVVGVLAALLRQPAVSQSVLLFGVVLMAVFFAVLIFGYLWPMLTAVELPLAAAIKNAVILPFACLHHSLPAAAVCILLLAVSFWTFPISLPLVLFVPFGIGSFVMSFAAWSDIRRLVIRQSTQNGGNDHD